MSDDEPVRYRMEVLCFGETTWSTNALTFDTGDQARDYAERLYTRWTLAKHMRVVPTTTPLREKYEPGSELF